MPQTNNWVRGLSGSCNLEKFRNNFNENISNIQSVFLHVELSTVYYTSIIIHNYIGNFIDRISAQNFYRESEKAERRKVLNLPRNPKCLNTMLSLSRSRCLPQGFFSREHLKAFSVPLPQPHASLFLRLIAALINFRYPNLRPEFNPTPSMFLGRVFAFEGAWVSDIRGGISFQPL